MWVGGWQTSWHLSIWKIEVNSKQTDEAEFSVATQYPLLSVCFSLLFDYELSPAHLTWTDTLLQVWLEITDNLFLIFTSRLKDVLHNDKAITIRITVEENHSICRACFFHHMNKNYYIKLFVPNLAQYLNVVYAPLERSVCFTIATGWNRHTGSRYLFDGQIFAELLEIDPPFRQLELFLVVIYFFPLKANVVLKSLMAIGLDMR